MDLMEKYMEAGRTFEENWTELPVGKGGVELFPGGVLGIKKYSLNDAVLREAAIKKVKAKDLDLRSGSEKLKNSKIAKIRRR